MDTTQLTELTSLLAEADPAAAPDIADRITEILAGGLEGPGETTGESTD